MTKLQQAIVTPCVYGLLGLAFGGKLGFLLVFLYACWAVWFFYDEAV